MLMKSVSFVCFSAAAQQVTLRNSEAGNYKMKTHSTNRLSAENCSVGKPRTRQAMLWTKLSALVCGVGVLISGCYTPPTPLFEPDLTPYGSVQLREGDAIAVTFPGEPKLNTTQRIRRDGKIDLQLVGEVVAAGKTPAELEKDILNLYKDQLVLKEVTVTPQSAGFPVYVAGAVVHPGKIVAERPITALEAIMEAGGFDVVKANIKKVTVIRREEGQQKRYVLNLKHELDRPTKNLFYMRPNDIVWVPEKAL